jgi:hypothetical protein
MRAAAFASTARVLSWVAAACLACGCTVPVSDRCNTTGDCLGGICVGGICRAPGTGDASPPEVAQQAPAVDARADGASDARADTDDADRPNLDSQGPDGEPDTHGADGQGGDGERGDGGAGDAAGGVDGHDGGGPVHSACPAWADWPMPSPRSTVFTADAPGNLPNLQSYDTRDPDVVVDDVTHLVWQRSPSPDAMSWSDAAAYCAGLAVGGRTGWRLPSRIELVSLIDYAVPDGTPTPARLDATAFADAYAGKVWSCSSGAANPTIGWFVDFSSGAAFTETTDKLLHVRCLTGASLATPAPARYDLGTPGEVRDTKTLLTWAADPIPDVVNWGQAYTYCQNLGAGWRLPTLTEAQTLIDETHTKPAFDPTAFPDQPDDFYWTSSYAVGDSEVAWFVSIGAGNTYFIPTTQVHRARCVR